MRERSRILVAVALIIGSIFFRPISSATAQEDQTLKVGALLSLSGGLEQWGNYLRQGIEIALSEEDGELIKIVIEDDHSVDLKATTSAARRLIDIDGADIIFSWTNATVPVLTPINKRARAPLLSPSYDERIAQSGEYIFGTLINYSTIPRDIVKFFQSRGAKRLGLVLASDSWSMGFEAPFRDEAKLRGLDVVFSETIDPKETETRTIVAKLEKLNVDGILAPLYGPSLMSFIKRHRESRSESLINVADGMFEDDIKTLGDAAEGVTAMQIWLESSDLETKVKKRFGETANALQLGLIAQGYDCIKHLAGAAKTLRATGRAVNRENLNSILKEFSSVGYLGPMMLGAPPKQRGEQVVMVERGKYRLVNFTQPPQP